MGFKEIQKLSGILGRVQESGDVKLAIGIVPAFVRFKSPEFGYGTYGFDTTGKEVGEFEDPIKSKINQAIRSKFIDKFDFTDLLNSGDDVSIPTPSGVRSLSLVYEGYSGKFVVTVETSGSIEELNEWFYGASLDLLHSIFGEEIDLGVSGEEDIVRTVDDYNGETVEDVETVDYYITPEIPIFEFHQVSASMSLMGKDFDLF